MLYTLNGFLIGAIGFALIDLFNKFEKFSLKLTPLFVVFIAFCFSMTTGLIWGSFEYGLDKHLEINCQKDIYLDRINTVSFDETKSNIVDSIDINKVVINNEI